jgi:uncharacterized protein DUF4058
LDSSPPPETLVMRSPFPGMDPFLEHFWGDVQHSMITRTSHAIQKQLPQGLVARIDVREFIEPIESWPRDEAAKFERLGGSLAHSEPSRQGFIKIIDRTADRRVVTVIEILKPSNKFLGPGRDLYLTKQEELRAGGVSLVVIDLNRTGSHVLSAPFDRIPEGHRTPYAACVRRGWKPQEIDYYPIALRERLPAIAIPLRHDDCDVPLDLQAVLDQCYEDAAYDDIDYREEPDPPLKPDDARWADELLREKGLR